ncbi:MAG TPA: hypothetical protein VF765_07380 [Polyangiaceae bacterium]
MPIAAIVLAAHDFAATFDASNRTEVRGRETQGAPPPNPGLDIVDAPALALHAKNGIWDLGLGYAALALLPDVEVGVTPQLTQTADASVEWQERRVRMRLGETGLFGDQNSAYLLGGGPPTPSATPSTPTVTPAGGGVQALTPPATLLYGSSRTSLAAQYALSRRWSASATIDYSITGGLDAPSRAFLPVVRSPRGEGAIQYSLTRLDGLGTRLSALRADTSSGPCSVALTTLPPNSTCSPIVEEVQLEEAWTHRLTRTSDVSFGGGATFVHEQSRAIDPFVDVLYPVARATFTDSEGTTDSALQLRFEALLAPVLDIRTGILDERVQANATAAVPIRRVTIDGGLGATRSIASQFLQPLTTVQAFVEAEYALSKTVGVGGGVRFAWQNQEGAGSFTGEMLSGHLTVRLPTARF